VLEIDDVTAGYGRTTVLRGASLKVTSGSVVALLGPNGAGKTTLLRVACGMLRAQAGRVVLDGVNVTNHSVHDIAARGVCLIPEGRGVFPSLSVRENLILFGKGGRRGARESVDWAVEAFPALGRRLSLSAGSLSGGEQQMLAMAHAGVSKPRVVIVDEASMGLAPMIVDRIFVYMTQLRDQGSSILVVEQYIHRALALADHVYLLRRGQIVFSGVPADLDAENIFEEYAGLDTGAASESQASASAGEL
jgi:branched-chain amino acid transport system ATP-binding protein